MSGTLDLHFQIADAASDRCAVILDGPNPNDYFLGPDDRFRRLVDLVAEVHHADGRAAVVLSTRGCVQHPVEGGGPIPLRLPPADSAPGAALDALCRQLTSTGTPVVVIFDYCDLVLPEGAPGGQSSADQQLLLELLAAFTQDPALAAHRLVLIARADSLDRRLARFLGWREVSVEVPDEAHRLRFLERLVARWEGSGSDAFEPGVDIATIARSTGGMTCDELVRAAMAAAERAEPLTRRWVQATKIRAIRQHGGDGVDVFPPGGGMADIAGLPQVRLFLDERVRSGLWPRAVILTGPPGVGKTAVVTAIADELGWPAMTLGAIHSMWHGESERNLRRQLSLHRAMAPVVVQVDEADQALGQRNTGPSANGGTSERLMAELWNFLGTSAPDLRILFVLTTNRVDALDEATRSRSEILPILHPTPSEAVDLLVLELAKRGQPLPRDDVAELLDAHGPDLFSGRILSRLADRATTAALVDGRARVEPRDLLQALGDLLERVDPIADERSALAAIQLASFAPHLPWIAARQRGEEPELLSYVAPLLRADGLPDPERLAARIAELDGLAAVRRSRRSA
jgi:ATP-dependent 26S proteasome regulatory subunit